MAIVKMSDGQLHKRLKKLMREMWKNVRKTCSDILVALVEMRDRIERSVRIQNTLRILEDRGRHDLIACAYNGVRFE